MEPGAAAASVEGISVEMLEIHIDLLPHILNMEGADSPKTLATTNALILGIVSCLYVCLYYLNIFLTCISTQYVY